MHRTSTNERTKAGLSFAVIELQHSKTFLCSYNIGRDVSISTFTPPHFGPIKYSAGRPVSAV